MRHSSSSRCRAITRSLGSHFRTCRVAWAVTRRLHGWLQIISMLAGIRSYRSHTMLGSNGSKKSGSSEICTLSCCLWRAAVACFSFLISHTSSDWLAKKMHCPLLFVQSVCNCLCLCLRCTDMPGCLEERQCSSSVHKQGRSYTHMSSWLLQKLDLSFERKWNETYRSAGGQGYSLEPPTSSIARGRENCQTAIVCHTCVETAANVSSYFKWYVHD